MQKKAIDTHNAKSGGKSAYAFSKSVVYSSKIFNSNLLIFAVKILKFSVRC